MTDTIPAEGTPAPGFTLPSSTGQPISLDELKGKQTVVLYFYPRDDTPGCTTEACSFRDLSPDFAAHNAVILGVSADPVSSHQRFAAKHTLPFPLLADEGGAVARAYGSWREEKGTPQRNTFVIDKNGVIRRVYHQVNVEQHVPEVLSFVTSLEQE